jgi:hypothetical protein
MHESLGGVMNDLDKEEQKEILKDAFREVAQEWLDKQFATFGKWTAAGIASALLVLAFYLWMTMNGWHKGA